jgi:4-amino-4-deoxy-L-arabinose transferase-like glycosyltransferase
MGVLDQPLCEARRQRHNSRRAGSACDQDAGLILQEDVLMILGMPLFTFVHVLISLAAIVAGVVAVEGWLTSHPREGWTALFFVMIAATSLTGFGFPFDHFLPSHWLGVLSLIALGLALLARYVFHYAGPWRWIYVISFVIALYFDVFVAIVQAFQKIPPLTPMQSGPVFAITQVLALAVFVALAIYSGMRFQPSIASHDAVPLSTRR